MRLSVIGKIEDEIRTIEAELLDKLPKEIQKARELGDLSENAEYASAKERQRLLNARLTQLAQRLAKLRLIDMSKIPRDVVGLGSTVVLYDVDEDREITYELVTSEESDVAAGKISTSSPIGRSLIGKREGDCAMAQTPRGSKEFEVVSMQTIYAKGGSD
ncbi:MAG: transcription elongation factor GreA [Bryobacterales bacterium]|nr:transcription elongation factor GreA [Bryobacterales bacterium]